MGGEMGHSGAQWSSDVFAPLLRASLPLGVGPPACLVITADHEPYIQ